MTQIPDNLQEVLAMALRNEERAKEILENGINNAKSALGRATFEYLASQEIEHMRIIKDYAQAVASGVGAAIQELPQNTKRQDGEKIKSIFEKYANEFEKVGQSGEERMDIYETAMQMERDGFNFYSAAAKQASDSNAVKLYEFLSREEERHFELIQDTRDFLQLPDALLAIEEHWMTI